MIQQAHARVGRGQWQHQIEQPDEPDRVELRSHSDRVQDGEHGRPTQRGQEMAPGIPSFGFPVDPGGQARTHQSSHEDRGREQKIERKVVDVGIGQRRKYQQARESGDHAAPQPEDQWAHDIHPYIFTFTCPGTAPRSMAKDRMRSRSPRRWRVGVTSSSPERVLMFSS
jgi:hypothetical protein